jgi:hypothetical protein
MFVTGPVAAVAGATDATQSCATFAAEDSAFCMVVTAAMAQMAGQSEAAATGGACHLVLVFSNVNWLPARRAGNLH